MPVLFFYTRFTLFYIYRYDIEQSNVYDSTYSLAR